MRCTVSVKPFYSSFGVRRGPKGLGMPLSLSPTQARLGSSLGHPSEARGSAASRGVVLAV